MAKQTRYWVRRIVFLILIGMVGFTIYQMTVGSEPKQPNVGDIAPDFELQTLDGKKMRLSDLKGKVVMLNFWATWCPPCKQEMPVMQEAYQKYKDQGFEIAAVNIGETDVAVQSFAKTQGLTFPIWLDYNKDITRQYKIGPIPSSFFIDANGIVAKKNEGPVNLAQLSGYIQELLPK